MKLIKKTQKVEKFYRTNIMAHDYGDGIVRVTIQEIPEKEFIEEKSTDITGTQELTERLNMKHFGENESRFDFHSMRSYAVYHD